MWLDRSRNDKTANLSGLPPEERLTITLLGNSRSLVDELIHEAMEISYAKHEGKTWIYTCKAFAQNWTRTCSKSKREFSSVILREGVAEQIINDVSRFLISESWYNFFAECPIAEVTYSTDLLEAERLHSSWRWQDNWISVCAF